MEQEIDTNALGEAIVKTLKTIYDPEIPVDIYELGLIYDVMVNTDYEVKILMTLTSKLSCSRKFTKRVEDKVKSIKSVKD
jgi:metal-sulfur cluster biosynthetic enzyme